MSHVQLKNIKKAYGSHLALKDVSLSIDRGAFFTLLGPSGCGKTTLLRAIAGFHQQDAGEILLEGQSIGHLGANKRNVGMVFQDYAVFPHLSVFDNVAFGLVQQKVPATEIRERVGAILATVQLDQHAERMPHQLSGGQQQRVGLARALVIRPKVLLMDEPLSNLDAKLRVELRRDIRSLQQTLDITTVYVTHDQEEALSISDQVCVMHDGVVQQVGTPWIVYNRPANRFVATFVGSNNFIPVVLDAAGQPLILGQSLEVPKSVRSQGAQGLVASIRPERVAGQRSLFRAGRASEWVVRQAMFTGRELQLTVEVAGHGLLDALTEPSAVMIALKPGDPVKLGVRAEDFLYFAPGVTGMLLQ
ncbi:MAG: ABC transporter ATP-binding protein [Betaproteobacteria bacterium]|nr:ABC transporter ATP-binding protein [Betaproteobacteria bacterium]